MIVGLSRQKVYRVGKLWAKVLLLIVLILYILPKLLTLFWEVNTGPKIQDERLPDKPLRVISVSVNST